MKPAVMIGTEDRIMYRWVQFAKKYSFLPLIDDGSVKIQPVYVFDLASAIVVALKDDGTSMGKVYELGGPEIFTVHELAIAMPIEVLLKKAPFPLPNPDIFNLDHIHAFSTDTVVSENVKTHNSYRKQRSKSIEINCDILLVDPIQNIQKPNQTMSRTSIAPEISLGSSNHINFDGSNVGATMFIRRGMSSEPEGCCCINIYTNSNVQGTNASVLLGSYIKMKNPGAHHYFGDFKLGEGFPTSRSVSRMTIGATLEFGSFVLFVLIPVILFLLSSSLLL